MSLYELSTPPGDLDAPVLVVGLDGWIDAGLGGSVASDHLLTTVPTEVLARFDNDALVDHRARRPTLRIEDGVNRGITWPEIELRVGQDRTGAWILVLSGPEPDMQWHAFTRAVADLATDLGVRLACGLGAFPAPVPHTRPVRLVATATNQALADRVGFMPGIIEVPAGIGAALEQAFAAVGIDAVGLWARVPHYVSAMPYPAASAALLDGLADLAGLELDARELHSTALGTATRIDALIANSDDHAAMVHQLETSHDTTELGPPLDPTRLPSGDEIAAELERFLRGEE
ncbi:MAG TPA: PAC2 family protein [Acidimicrobiales bacterium]|nr:PAC2 family protein [Acidimicrobiales bacterium]